jgi:hypothetical protein
MLRGPTAAPIMIGCRLLDRTSLFFAVDVLARLGDLAMRLALDIGLLGQRSDRLAELRRSRSMSARSVLVS